MFDDTIPPEFTSPQTRELGRLYALRQMRIVEEWKRQRKWYRRLYRWILERLG